MAACTTKVCLASCGVAHVIPAVLHVVSQPVEERRGPDTSTGRLGHQAASGAQTFRGLASGRQPHANGYVGEPGGGFRTQSGFTNGWLAHNPDE